MVRSRRYPLRAQVAYAARGASPDDSAQRERREEGVMWNPTDRPLESRFFYFYAILRVRRLEWSVAGR